MATQQNSAVLDTVATILASKGSEVWHIAPTATVFEAIGMMATKGIGALPVVAGDRLVGVLSERDYARKVILQGRSSQHTTVEQIMDPPITVTPDTPVPICLRIMTSRKVRHLPVMDLGELVGIVSMGDLVNATIATQEFTIDQLQLYITADYPA